MKKVDQVCPPQNCCHLFVRFSLFEGRLLNLLRIALHLSRELERCSVPFPTICTPTTYLPSSATLQPPNLLFHVCRASRLTTTSTTSSIWIRAISHYFPLNILKPLPGDMLGTWDVLILDFFLEKRGITSSKRKISFNLYFYLLASLIEGRNTFCKEPNWIQFHF